MSNGIILLLVLLVGAPLLMFLMHRGGAHQGHGHGGSGGGCGGGGHSGHDYERPREEEQATPVLGKPGSRHHGEATPEGEGERAGGTRKRGC